jgi:hypothetical protein
LPGQSQLDVQPHPYLPAAYTVPFLGGQLLFAVPPGKGFVGIMEYRQG